MRFGTNGWRAVEGVELRRPSSIEMKSALGVDGEPESAVETFLAVAAMARVTAGDMSEA